MRIPLGLLLLAATLSPALAGDGFAIVGARVFDGERVQEGVTVIVEGERIAAVVQGAPPPGLAVVDGRGHTLLPGLIDCHTHPLQAADLRQSLVFGVTTSLSMMNRPELLRSIQEAQARGELRDLADVRGAGNPVTAPGGHGTQYGFPIPTVRGPERVPAFVAERIAEGADFIKIMYEHGEAYRGELPGLTTAELEAAVQAAHAHARLAVVHVGSRREGLEAIRAGADVLAHVWLDAPPTPEDLAKLERRPAVVLTLAVIEGIERRPGDPAPLAELAELRPYLTPYDLTGLRRSWVGLELAEGAGLATAQRAGATLRAAGFPILAGSDAPNPGVVHGASLHRELELLVAAGLSAVEALRAATSTPARVFALADRGRIAPGLRADLLLVAGDPTRDVTATRSIARVWKAGAALDRQAYARAVEAELARLRALPSPPGLDEGPVADFEQGRLAARFGAFMPSTDALRGGDSSVRLSVVPGGAAGSRSCLRAEGTVTETARPFRWAAAYFAPAGVPMLPTNLSSRAGVRFRVRGQGPLYFAVTAQRLGIIPVIRRLEGGDAWRELRFTWDQLDGLDGTDINGLLFGADAPGDFWLELDDLRFE